MKSLYTGSSRNIKLFAVLSLISYIASDFLSPLAVSASTYHGANSNFILLSNAVIILLFVCMFSIISLTINVVRANF